MRSQLHWQSYSCDLLVLPMLFNEPFTESSNDIPDMIMKNVSKGFYCPHQKRLHHSALFSQPINIFFPFCYSSFCVSLSFFRHMTRDCITIGNSAIEIWSQIDPELDDGCRSGKWHGRNLSPFLSILTFLWKINIQDRY